VCPQTQKGLLRDILCAVLAAQHPERVEPDCATMLPNGIRVNTLITVGDGCHDLLVR
jgi:hypothetical protein